MRLPTPVVRVAMRHCPTVAVALSLSACEAGEPPPDPTIASPEPIDMWSTSTERNEPPPKAPPAASARIEKPELRNFEARPFRGTMRAYPRWKGERPRVRVLDGARLGVSDERAADELTGTEQQLRDEQLRMRELLQKLNEPAR